MGDNRFAGLLVLTTVFQVICGLSMLAGLILLVSYLDEPARGPFAMPDPLGPIRLVGAASLLFYGLTGMVFSGGINVLVGIYRNTASAGAVSGATGLGRASPSVAPAGIFQRVWQPDRALVKNMAIAVVVLMGLLLFFGFLQPAISYPGFLRYQPSTFYVYALLMLGLLAAAVVVVMNDQPGMRLAAGILAALCAVLVWVGAFNVLSLFVRYNFLTFAQAMRLLRYGLNPASWVLLPLAAVIFLRPGRPAGSA